jgi:AcrR family transcriptional regulator
LPAQSGGERADAQRNRQQLLDAAAAALTDSATATLESIARSAGVGIGTLYRHFPTRDALIEAVYRAELGRLCDRADELLAEQPPDQALRSWMDRYADFVATKRGMAQALRAVIASGAITSAQTRERMNAAIAGMLRAGVAAGTLRADVRAEDISASLAGVLWAAGGPDQREQADRLLDLLMAGIRTRG